MFGNDTLNATVKQMLVDQQIDNPERITVDDIANNLDDALRALNAIIQTATHMRDALTGNDSAALLNVVAANRGISGTNFNTRSLHEQAHTATECIANAYSTLRTTIILSK